MKRRKFLRGLWLSVSGMILAAVSPKLAKAVVNPALEEAKTAIGVTTAAHPAHPTWAETRKQGKGHSAKTAREDETFFGVCIFRCPSTDGGEEIALARVRRWEIKDHTLRGAFLSRDDERVSIGECEKIPDPFYLPVEICTFTPDEMSEFQQAIGREGS